MHYNRTQLKETVSTIALKINKRLSELDLRFLFDYRIFPPNIMSFYTQWHAESRTMKVGDTIVQQVFLPPIKTFSQKVIFGVRVNEIIDEPTRKGFSYETLAGHVEKGISTFTVEENEAGLLFKIHTFSGPGNLLSKVLAPVFSVPYQAFCTKAALENVWRQIV
ncbi:hypothetical protein DN068_04780 [Taibaiella soli]|uniref:DUF1990 domain-containing protein n=2 Tax=Taibaiella soli TaxID=1649169 RepID=A0A2W2AFL2_9BACT|nr:hypothetical protein DN068_04780 [Taibaiella soli]